MRAGPCWGHGAEGNSPLPKGSGQPVVPIQAHMGTAGRRVLLRIPRVREEDGHRKAPGAPAGTGRPSQMGLQLPLVEAGGGTRES